MPHDFAAISRSLLSTAEDTLPDLAWLDGAWSDPSALWKDLHQFASSRGAPFQSRPEDRYDLARTPTLPAILAQPSSLACSPRATSRWSSRLTPPSLLLVFTGAEDLETCGKEEATRAEAITRRVRSTLGDELQPDQILFFPLHAPPPDPEALSALSQEVGEDLDKLEELLEALALTAGPPRRG